MALNKSGILYEGLDADIIIRAVVNDTSLAAWGVPIEAGYKSKYNWHRTGVVNSIADYECKPTQRGSAELIQKQGDLCRLQTIYELCHDVLVGTYRERFLRGGVTGESILDDSALAAEIEADALENWRDTLDYLLVNSTGGIYDTVTCTNVGILAKLDAPGSGVLRETFGAITAANVITKLQAVYERYPAALRFRMRGGSRPKFMVSPDVVGAWFTAVNAPATSSGTGLSGTFTNMDPTQAPVMQFRGIQMDVVNNLPAGSIILTDPTNLRIFTDAESDWNNLRIIDLSLTTADDVLLYKLEAGIGIEFMIGEEIAAHLNV